MLCGKVYPNVADSFSYLLESGDETEKNWSHLKPYARRVKNTIYCQYLLIALRDLYGFEDEEVRDDWKELSDEIRERSRENPEWSLRPLKNMGKNYRGKRERSL